MSRQGHYCGSEWRRGTLWDYVAVLLGSGIDLDVSAALDIAMGDLTNPAAAAVYPCPSSIATGVGLEVGVQSRSSSTLQAPT